MGLFLTTTGVDVSIPELGVTIVHPTSNLEISAQFNASDIKNANSLTAAILAGTLQWRKISGGAAESAANYDPDWVRLEEESTGTGNPEDRVILKSNLTALNLKNKYLARLVAAQTRSQTSFANLGLTSTLPIGNYRFQAIIRFQTAATTTGIGLRLNNPNPNAASVSDLAIRWQVPIGADQANNNVASYSQFSLNDNVVTTGVGVANTDYIAIAMGYLTVSAAGDVNLQFRSEVNGSLVTVQAGSFMFIEEI